MSETYDLRHYSADPAWTLDRSRTYEQDRDRRDKPNGLWVSAGGDWRRWREDESWGIPPTEHAYRVTLAPSANLLVLLTPFDVHGLTKRWAAAPRYASERAAPGWLQIIASGYDGILIPDYHWSCRHSVDWYYGWDCASGCIWNLDAIASVALADTLTYAPR